MNKYFNKRIAIILSIIMVFTVFMYMPEKANAATTINESESNNTIGSADTFTFGNGNTFKGKLSSDSDVDWIKVTVPASGKVKLTYTATHTVQDYWDLYVEYYCATNTSDAFDFNTIFNNDNLGYGYGSYDRYLSKGTYYLRLSDYACSYQIVMNYEASGEVKEPNDYISNATTLGLGSVAKGMIADTSIVPALVGNDDKDFYKVLISSKGKYYVTVTGKFNNWYDAIEIDDYTSTGASRGNYYTLNKDENNTISRKSYLSTLPAGSHYFLAEGDTCLYSLSVTKQLSKITGVKTKKAGKKKIKISWKAKGGATGYQVYRATSKHGKYKHITTVKNTSYVNKKLKKNKKYYYKVRAYRTVNGYAGKGVFSKTISKVAK